MKSEIRLLGSVALPMFNEVRVQMMPFLVHQPEVSLPAKLAPWRALIAEICHYAGERGTGYVTLDESHVLKGDHHRCPGLHVDCGGPLLTHGGSPPAPPKHGGSPGPQPPNHGASSSRGGMYVVASSLGSRGWLGEFAGEQGDEGNCSHLSGILGRATQLEAGELFWCNSTFIHETLAAQKSGPRQFLRVSMPSAAPWHANYTRNPLGVMPGGPIAAARTEQMSYRA